MCGISYYSNKPATKEVHGVVQERKRNRDVLNAVQYMSDYLPSEYEEWEKGQFERIMLLRKSDKKHNIGYCECGAKVELSVMRSGSMIQCPECKKFVRATKVLRERWEQQALFAYITAEVGGWVQRLFVSSKQTWVQGDRAMTAIYRHEEERDYTDGNETWFFHPVYGDNDRWIPGPGRVHGMGWAGWRICDMPLRTFPNNLKSLFGRSKYKYSALDIAAEHSHVNPFYYLRTYDSEPRLEMIYKLGLYKVGEQLLDNSYGCDDRKRIFANVKSLKDLGIKGQADIAECKNLTIQEIIARKEVKEWNLPEESRALAIAFIAKVNERCGKDFKYSFITRRQWFKYYLSQRGAYSEVRNFIIDYTDYISDCIALKYDMTDSQVVMPKCLSSAHERSITARKYREEEECKKNFCTQVQKWLKASYADKDFEIAVIPTHEMLLKEAKAMRNCSAGYAGRIADGSCSIWTIRRRSEPNTAFYMLELSKDGSVIQCRGVATASGYGGQPPATPEIETFVEKWKAKKVIPLLNQLHAAIGA